MLTYRNRNRPNNDPARRAENTTVDSPRSALRGMSYADGQAALSPQENIQMTPATNGVGQQDAIINNAADHSLGEVAAAYTRKQDMTQSDQIDERGYGDYVGTKSSETHRNGQRLTKTDCTIFVLNILKQAFAAKGRDADWTSVMAQARRTSGSGGFRGTELMRALQSGLGWVGLFWAPDSKSSDGEHAYSARKAASRGSYYGINVDTDKLITDYRPENDSRSAEMDAIHRLRRIPFGVVAARGGSHMALVLDGHIFEVHWSYDSDSHDLIESTDLSQWAWGSGAIVVPPEDAANWNDPLTAQ